MKLSVKNCLVAAAAIVTATVGAAGTSYAQAASKYRIAYIARAQGDSFAAWLANEMVAQAKQYPDISATVFDGQSRNDLIEAHIWTAVKNKFDLVIIQTYDPPTHPNRLKQALATCLHAITT